MPKSKTDNIDATVSVGMGATINTGNYESLRVDVGVSLPCNPSDVDAVYEALHQKVENLLKERVVRIKKIGGME